MPVSPDDGARLASRMLDLVTAAELTVLREIARHVASSLQSPDWLAASAADLAQLRAEITALIPGFGRALAMQAGDVIDVAYMLGAAHAATDLEEGGIPPVIPQGTIVAVGLLADEVAARVSVAGPRILRAVADAYQTVVAGVVGNVLLGAQTRLQAAQTALDALLADGISGFTDKAGRQWRLESYVEMAVRTAAGTAAVQGHVDTLTLSGHDLALLIPGPLACDICDAWSRKIVSLTGQAPGYPTLADARAAGWGHPNCRCAIGAYFPGLTKVPAGRPDPAGYEASQRQRYYERRARYWDRRAALALTPSAVDHARARRRVAQGKVRAHLAEHPDLMRRPERERAGRAL